MELVTIGIGLLVNTVVKNKAVNSAVDDFVTDSVNWMRGWFKKKDEVQLVEKLEKNPKDPDVERELKVSMNEMVKDEQFRKELQLWIKESKKPNPSMKNVLEDVEIEVEGNIKIGDKTSSTEKHDMKNVIKKGKIKGGGDFVLGDG